VQESGQLWVRGKNTKGNGTGLPQKKAVTVFTRVNIPRVAKDGLIPVDIAGCYESAVVLYGMVNNEQVNNILIGQLLKPSIAQLYRILQRCALVDTLIITQC
jgi:hypothetical protein